jgi:hypothetical protein
MNEPSRKKKEGCLGHLRLTTPTGSGEGGVPGFPGDLITIKGSDRRMGNGQALRNPRARLAYEFIKAHRRQYPSEVMCRTLDVAPSGDPDPRLLQSQSRLRSSADIPRPAGSR